MNRARRMVYVYLAVTALLLLAAVAGFEAGSIAIVWWLVGIAVFTFLLAVRARLVAYRQESR